MSTERAEPYYITVDDVVRHVNYDIEAQKKWAKLTDDQRITVILMAENDIDTLKYIGSPCEDGQPHAFPRNTKRVYSINYETEMRLQSYSNIVPTKVRKAVLEQVLYILKGLDYSAIKRLQKQVGAKSISISSIRLTFESQDAEPISEKAMSILDDLLLFTHSVREG
jgi:hypothetical protein